MKTPVPRICKFLKLKEVTYSVGAICRGGLSLSKAEKHFNIGNDDHQHFSLLKPVSEKWFDFRWLKHPQILVSVDLEAGLW